MKTKALLGCLTIALLVTGACSTATNTNTNTNTANKNTTAATPAPTSTPAPAAPSNAAADTASAEGKQDFTLRNETGVIIDQLFVSPSDKDEWGEDILGKDTLPNGESVEIVFSPKEKAAKWDLKVMDSKGNSIEWNDLNLMEISEVTLNFENGKGTAIVK
ncbi:MAG: hypothetical protein H7Y30_13525 [Pyrinomonadaceae bacterium]|nr:hypothetical protein [Pyrinomonadaceae bacterium]